MNKCVGAIEEFEFLPLRSGKHLHLTIAVTGWLCTGKYSKCGFCRLTTRAYSRHSLGELGKSFIMVYVHLHGNMYACVCVYTHVYTVRAFVRYLNRIWLKGK